MQIRIESSFDSDVLQLVPDVGVRRSGRAPGAQAAEVAATGTKTVFNSITRF